MNSQKRNLSGLLSMAMVMMGLRQTSASETLPSFFSLKAKSIDGKDSDLSQYSGKVVMVVNVASQCGFTPQYAELEKLYQKYKSQGFVILGFPSNDFGGQEPGGDAEIKKFCQLNYGVTFPLFTKGPVTGDQIQPIYRYLTVDAGPGMGGRVLWNFEKFIVNKAGKPVERFRSITKPTSSKVTTVIEKLLGESAQP